MSITGMPLPEWTPLTDAKDGLTLEHLVLAADRPENNPANDSPSAVIPSPKRMYEYTGVSKVTGMQGDSYVAEFKEGDSGYHVPQCTTSKTNFKLKPVEVEIQWKTLKGDFTQMQTEERPSVNASDATIRKFEERMGILKATLAELMKATIALRREGAEVDLVTKWKSPPAAKPA